MDRAPEVAGLRPVVNCSILFTGLPLLERPAAARRAGFDAVEFWWPFPASVPPDRDVDAFVRALADAGVALTGLNFAAGDLAAGERGMVAHPDRAAEFADNVDVVAGIGERTGCRGFNALYGNRLAGHPAGLQDETATANLVRAARALAPLGGTVLVEPVSAVAGYPLRTSADVRAVLDRVTAAGAVTNVALLADLYHLAVNGDDIPAMVADHTHRVGHVQIADAPGRGAPGTGTLPLLDWLEALRRNGYTGLVSLEYTSDNEDPFAWLTTGP